MLTLESIQAVQGVTVIILLRLENNDLSNSSYGATSLIEIGYSATVIEGTRDVLDVS